MLTTKEYREIFVAAQKHVFITHNSLEFQAIPYVYLHIFAPIRKEMQLIRFNF